MVKIDSAVVSDPKEAVKALEGEYGIGKLDMVIANAGICDNLYTGTYNLGGFLLQLICLMMGWSREMYRGQRGLSFPSNSLCFIDLTAPAKSDALTSIYHL